MSFLTPLAFLAALLAIPIVLLYMLRLRRREQVVSSNFLWQQILQDREANTPWQRLRRNSLLLLQLLILALLVLALARPVQIVPTISAQKTVILLDASASMNATDLAAGRSRFAEAQQQALNILSEAGTEDQISLIRVGSTVDPLMSYTNDFAALREAILSAEPGQGRGDWETALTLAAAGAAGADSFRIILITDGGIDVTDVLPENIPQPFVIPVGQASDNLAITALATDSLPGQAPQLFVQVRNYSEEPAEVAVLIRLDGEIWDSSTQTISGSSQRSFVFQVDQDFQTVQAELILDDSVPDYLALDNVAYAVATERQTRRLLLLSAERSVFVEQVLRSLPEVQVFQGDTSRATLPEQPYDIYVFNGWLPAALPDADMLILNPPQSTSLFTLGDAVEDVGAIRIADGSHPLAAFLNVSAVNLLRYRPVSNAPWAVPILRVESGAVLLAGEIGNQQIALLPFDLRESDLPLQVAWPVFMANALDWFAPADLLLQTAVGVGDPVAITPPLNADRVQIIPSQSDARFVDVTGSALSFSDTQQPGIYQVAAFAGDEPVAEQAFSVNLFGSESRIAPRPPQDLVLGGGSATADEQEEPLGLREYWWILALILLGLLVLEWSLYYRGLRPPTRVTASVRRTTARS
ncbi:MAG: VWA domain-containing protein [Anaerolineae bacterium]|nr:VWA domain-containing protein [Anaerolineae bacterium]